MPLNLFSTALSFKYIRNYLTCLIEANVAVCFFKTSSLSNSAWAAAFAAAVTGLFNSIPCFCLNGLNPSDSFNTS